MQPQSGSAYSWSAFGREAEYVIALYLKSRGWQVTLSKGSRGPADITAQKKDRQWLIQVKASSKIPRLKGYEVKRLQDLASKTGGEAVIATLQSGHASEKDSIFETGNYGLYFYSLADWGALNP